MNLHLKDAAVEDVPSRFEELWLAEAKRRLEELHSGKVEGIDGEEAITTIREVLALHAKNRLREDRPS